MGNNYKISIIVPVYNSEKDLDKCLKSILSQTLKEIELIIVNDGSKDNSLNIINKYIKLDKRITLINQKNSGAAIARNNAITIAKSDFIAFVDSDDYIEKEMYETMYNEAIKYNVDIVTCQFRKINSNNTIDYSTTIKNKENLENVFLGKVFSVLWNKIYKKELFVKNRIMIDKNIYYEDIGIVYKLYYFTKKIHTIPNVFYNWNNREGSATESFSTKHIKSMFYILNDMHDFMLEYKPCSFELFIQKYCFNINFLFNRVLHFSENLKEAKKLYKLITKNLNINLILDDENILLLKNRDIILYHKIIFYLSLKNFFHEINSREIKKLSELLSIKIGNTSADDESTNILTLKEIISIKKDIYKKNNIDFLKIDFSKKINFLYKDIYKLKETYKKIAIYGNGLIGNIIAKELDKNLTVIFDKNTNLASSYSKVDIPNNINKYSFDILIISVLGREEEIKKEITQINTKSKIKIFSFEIPI